jgi:hypothetical protein
LLDNISLFINLLYVEHPILDIGIIGKAILQQSDSFKVAHPIDERLAI